MILDRRTILSFTIVVSFVVVIFVWIFFPPSDPDQMAVLNMLIGALIGQVTTVVAFDFGSSDGSKAKDDALVAAAERTDASK
jgi:hypothetical protein